jgi:hypothetical protein
MEPPRLSAPGYGAPIWFARYDHKRNKIVLIIVGNSGYLINSIGL